MSLDNVLKLLLLFENKDVLTMKDMVNSTKLSPRHIYRLLNTLSEHNIPIYYDYDLKGYKLVRKLGLRLTNFNFVEELYIISSLMFVNEHNLDKGVRNFIDTLSICSKNIQLYDIENLKTQLDGVNEIKDYFSKIHFLIIEKAIENQLDLKIWSSKQKKTIVIKNPQLVIGKCCQVRNKKKVEACVDLEHVNRIAIINTR